MPMPKVMLPPAPQDDPAAQLLAIQQAAAAQAAPAPDPDPYNIADLTAKLDAMRQSQGANLDSILAGTNAALTGLQGQTQAAGTTADQRIQSVLQQALGNSQQTVDPLLADLRAQGFNGAPVQAQVGANNAAMTDQGALQRSLSARLAQNAGSALTDRQNTASLINQGAKSNLESQISQALLAAQQANTAARSGGGGGGRGGGGGSYGSPYTTFTDSMTDTASQGQNDGTTDTYDESSPFSSLFDAIANAHLKQKGLKLLGAQIMPDRDIDPRKTMATVQYLMDKVGWNPQKAVQALANMKGSTVGGIQKGDLQSIIRSQFLNPKNVKTQTKSASSSSQKSTQTSKQSTTQKIKGGAS